jgi:superfamily II DNA or RNA helicase/diadenosine tetraphosphate (Ap4A) HIT family hydrolase
MSCHLCDISPERVFWHDDDVVAIMDPDPASPGHALVILRRHVATIFEATPAERAALWRAVEQVKGWLDACLSPDGYNVAVDAGAAAGQAPMHAHVHVIPRYEGDTDGPSGARHLIPAAPGAPGGPASHLTTGGDDGFERALRRALRRARRVDVVASFVRTSGVAYLREDLEGALERGAQIRVLTGDYLYITQAGALRRLLELGALGALREADDESPAGALDLRVVETASIGGRSFHPKSWRIETESEAVAWVGSSNWSRMALTGGIEWNLCVRRAHSPAAYAQIVAAFDALWRQARVVDRAWVDAYAARAASHQRPLPPEFAAVVAEPEAPATDPTAWAPLGVQPAALAALASAREQGRARALVVLATGLGKTFLAAFDARRVGADLGRTPRVLFIAHRIELLRQARQTFLRLFEGATTGFYAGSSADLGADLVFASNHKLAGAQGIRDLRASRFDYVVVDECHHATARTYRRILSAVDAGFVLGLTATPERADQAHVAGLFDDHVAFRAGIAEGIALERLVPFDYVGLKDTIAFDPIPWRSYTADRLSELAETQERMEALHEAWREHPGSRTLVFCTTISHADFVARWLTDRGLRVVACHSGEGAADREASLEALSRGELDAIASVDLFNEGIDVPLIDRVIMLRPTTSPVIFLQQLGRGLRVAPGKERLQVLDFIGNHEAFLGKVRALLSLSSSPRSLRELTEGGGEGALELGAGCRAEIELDVIDMLSRLAPDHSDNELARVYRELRDARGERPAAGELVRRGLNPRSLGVPWFEFVRDEGDLERAEHDALAAGGAWFSSLQRLPSARLLECVALEVLLEEPDLEARLDDLSARCRAALGRDDALGRGVEGFGAAMGDQAWADLWEELLVDRWRESRWYGVEQGRARVRVRVSDEEVAGALWSMAAELVDCKLAHHRRLNAHADEHGAGFVCRVIQNASGPILKLPDIPRELMPHGPTVVRLEDGGVWEFKFVKIACNVARPVGSTANALADLLRGWFGASAGKPGTAFDVRFRRAPESWWAEPLGVMAEVEDLNEIKAFPSLRAAAGEARGRAGALPATRLRLPGVSAPAFAVRACGDSMRGGAAPIRDGDWVVLEWARGEPLSEVIDRVALFETDEGGGATSYRLKRLVRGTSGDLIMASDNPARPDVEDTSGTTLIARHVATVTPEALAPRAGEVVADIAEAFGLSAQPPPGVSRVDGHLFMVVTQKGELAAANEVALEVPDRGESETAYVLTRTQGGYRYAGVGRLESGRWVIPYVDFATWRAFGAEKGGVSRDLDPKWVEAASRLVAFIEGRCEPGQIIGPAKRRCAYLGSTSKGGVRVQKEGSSRPRGVSATDLAWVLAANDRAAANPGRLDEAWVNRLRYLDGTPKGSTRYIDTGWAIALLEHAVGLGFVANGLQ